MRMKLLSTSALALVGLTSAALAADLPVYTKAPVKPTPVFNWTGFYVGASAGFTWSNSDPVNSSTTNLSALAGLNGDVGSAVATQGTGSTSPKSDGFLGGGQIGYNWQAARYVYGLEADLRGFGGSQGSGTISNVGTVPGAFTVISSTGVITSTKTLDYLGTVRGRFGFLGSPNLLLYGTGGFAYGGVSTGTSIVETLGFTDTTGTFGSSGRWSGVRAGWTAGAGAEWMFAPNWSAKVEYRYYDLGTATNNLGTFQQFGGFGTTLETVSASRSTTRFNGSDVSIGVNRHF
jgi:outer membrane immunogenic protein